MFYHNRKETNTEICQESEISVENLTILYFGGMWKIFGLENPLDVVGRA